MATVADRYTDKTFSQLESRISKMYREAREDLKKKLADFTRHHKAKDAEMRKKLRSGEITQAQYQQWMTGQVFVGKQWKQKIEQVNSSIKNVMQEASNLTHGKSMDVFAENANYTAYQLEKDLKANINFGLYDTSTVSRLVGKDPEILPRRVVNGRKLDAWETKKISNAISQGIIQGEGIDQIASRIARDTCIAADHSSVMYARTAMTAAQNAGRMERLHEAEEMGIRVQKKWMATLDNRTRDSHADLDGEVVDVDDTFSNGLMYPGDPSTNDFAEICNCRCTMVYVYPDFKQSFERSAFLGYDENGHKQYETIKDMTYREWQASKKGTEAPRKELVKPDKPDKSNDKLLTFDSAEDKKRLEDQRKENAQLKEEYDRLNKEFLKTHDDENKAYSEIVELDRLEEFRKRDYSYFDKFNSEEELESRREYLNSRIRELYEKDDALVRPRMDDYSDEDKYWEARREWADKRSAIRDELGKLETEIREAYDTPRGGWSGIEKWRQARDTDIETIHERQNELRRKIANARIRRGEISDQQQEISTKIHTRNEAALVDDANARGVQYKAPSLFTEQPSFDKIMDRLGGGDETEGSCASLGFCYIGQKNGVDVLDFRGGSSLDMFSRKCRDTLRGIAAEMKKPIFEESTKTGTGGAIRLLKQCVPGKEYYFVTGRHAAIVRKVGNQFEYLELQQRKYSGWLSIGTEGDRQSLDFTFRCRFGCSNGISGQAMMMDIEDMKDSKLLQRSYGYMNTAADKQLKGEHGYAK